MCFAFVRHGPVLFLLLLLPFICRFSRHFQRVIAGLIQHNVRILRPLFQQIRQLLPRVENHQAVLGLFKGLHTLILYIQQGDGCLLPVVIIGKALARLH